VKAGNKVGMKKHFLHPLNTVRFYTFALYQKFINTCSWTIPEAEQHWILRFTIPFYIFDARIDLLR
jgi:hypothetical protein